MPSRAKQISHLKMKKISKFTLGKDILKYGEKKSVSAERFKEYKENCNTLADKLIENSYKSLEEVSQNMGWLTWASLFKTVLKAIVTK